MARGNRPARVTITLRIPPELDHLIQICIKLHRFDSRNDAIRYLIESHPEVLTIAGAICYPEPQRDIYTQGG